MKLKVSKAFNFAHRGCEVKAYAKGDEIDTDTADPELLKVAGEEGWIAKPKGSKETATAQPDPDKQAEPPAPGPGPEQGPAAAPDA